MTPKSIPLTELEPFVTEGHILDVLHVVKSGKEATVYCCAAHPATGVELLTAKVYRPRENRNFKNDAIYQAGRVIVNRRDRLAVQKKSHYGRELHFGMWIEQERETLEQLHAAGADVPRLIARADRALLMEYIGDRQEPATALSHVRLSPREVRPLFDNVMRNLQLWLRNDLIHGDLSPFNILYWRGRLTFIDFPQAVDPQTNPHAFALLARDVENVCAYWSRYGLRLHPQRITEDLWIRYQFGEL